ncbi:MAG: GxGYxYP family putative glycoside hydrolase [Oscillospiraceae bacterium]|nr:GxGYxYP family putative glycoside hydrolase [Oscillospiraceae bacterium]MDD4413513.1 GxGYxYP family putative glycoside hydrolase [Oscillospiraceae bacterium]
MAQLIDNKSDMFSKTKSLYYVYMEKILESQMSDAEKYDRFNFICSLQGLVNRDAPTLFIEWQKETDIFWFDHLTNGSSVFHKIPPIQINSFSELLNEFQTEIERRGLVVWDNMIPATSNVAATVSGVDGLLPVRYNSSEDSLYSILTKKLNIAIKLNLYNKFTGSGTIPDIDRKSSGSRKCDAYIWAMELYLDKTSVDYMAYFVDAATWGDDQQNPEYPNFQNINLPNRDYSIARKAFFFDLYSWADETPCDDPTQPLGSDLNTLKEIFQRQYDRHKGSKMAQISGYTPWQCKYTTYHSKGKHGGVETEWELTEIASAYNFVLDADSAAFSDLSNASIYMHYPLKNEYKNNKPDTSSIKKEKGKKYVYLFIGDYDSAAWLARFVPKFFNDPARGSIPMAWAFNPNLSDRVPMVFDYIYSHLTENDFITSGASGAGYINPSLLMEGQRVHSDNGDGLKAWEQWNINYFRKFDLSIIGFLINGDNEIPFELYNSYSKFAPVGIMSNQTIDKEKPLVYKGVSLVRCALDIAHENRSIQNRSESFDENAKNTAKTIVSQVNGSKVDTMAFRTILCSPSFIKAVYDYVKEYDESIEIVDPYTFYEIVKQ